MRNAFRNAADAIAASQVEVHYARVGPRAASIDAAERSAYLRSCRDHIAHLQSAVTHDMPDLFVQYTLWRAGVRCEGRISVEALVAELACLRHALIANLREDQGRLAVEIVDKAIAEVAVDPVAESVLRDSPQAELADAYLNALLAGDRRTASDLIRAAVENGLPVGDVYRHVLEPSQHEVGRRWQINTITVAQEHFCTAATQLVMSQLYDRLAPDEPNGLTIVATGAQGDLHEVGVRMVADFFEMAGWTSIYLGTSTPADAVIASVRTHDANVLAVSATLTNQLEEVQELIDSLRAQPDLRGVKVLVGGPPFTKNPELYRSVGADGYATNGDRAVTAGAELMSATR